jgi:hypothetical protein
MTYREKDVFNLGAPKVIELIESYTILTLFLLTRKNISDVYI